MATGSGSDPRPRVGAPRGPLPDPRAPGFRPRAERRRTLLSDIADLEPDRLDAGDRVGAALSLLIVVLLLAAGAGLLIYALFTAVA
jgi:hypothetical protein